MLTTKQLSEFLNVSPQTLRNYTDHFSEWLSDSATPPRGGTRSFTEADGDVLYAARQMLRDGLTYDETRDALARGAHLQSEYQPPEPEPKPSEAPGPGAIVRIDQLRPIIEPLREASEQWRQLAAEYEDLAEQRRQEIQRLQRENERLRSESRPWWQFWR